MQIWLKKNSQSQDILQISNQSHISVMMEIANHVNIISVQLSIKTKSTHIKYLISNVRSKVREATSYYQQSKARNCIS